MATSETMIDEVIDAQKAFAHAMQEAALPTLLASDLSMVQLKAIATLARRDPLTVGELAAALGIGKPAASILVERLVEQGLVERQEDPLDRRRSLLRLSISGEDLVFHLRQGKRERMRAWLICLNEADLAALAQGLSALVRVTAAGEAAPDLDRVTIN